MSRNPCQRCGQPGRCCLNFVPSSFFQQPHEAQRLARDITHRYPYIHPSGQTAIAVDEQDNTVLVPRLSCDRFDPRTKLCQDYDTQPRPQFCINTGPDAPFSPRCAYNQPLTPENPLKKFISPKNRKRLITN